MKKVTFILVACVKFVLKKLTFSILDPDPHCGSGSKRRNLGCLCKVCFKKAYFSHTGSRSALRIQIQTAKFLLIHADSDPKHFRLTMSTVLFVPIAQSPGGVPPEQPLPPAQGQVPGPPDEGGGGTEDGGQARH